MRNNATSPGQLTVYTLDLVHLPEPPHKLSDAEKDAELSKTDEFSIENVKTA